MNYDTNVQVPDKRIFKHFNINNNVPVITSELGLKVYNCPVGSSFAVINNSERCNVRNYAVRFGMKYTVRNTESDSYKRAFRIA